MAGPAKFPKGMAKLGIWRKGIEAPLMFWYPEGAAKNVQRDFESEQSRWVYVNVEVDGITSQHTFKHEDVSGVTVETQPMVQLI
jgi:hypothetical protein